MIAIDNNQMVPISSDSSFEKFKVPYQLLTTMRLGLICNYLYYSLGLSCKLELTRQPFLK